MLTRRTFSLLLVGAPALARADRIAVRPVIRVEAQPSSITTEGAPGRARFRIGNDTDRPMRVHLDQLFLLDARMRIPLTITRVSNGSGTTLAQPFRLPARGAKRVTVHFALPAESRGGSEWQFELRATSRGGVGRGTTTVTRAHRHPVHRLD